MTVKGDWDEFAKLALYCRIRIRMGDSGRRAMRRWRFHGNTIATKTFYEVWNHEMRKVLK